MSKICVITGKKANTQRSGRHKSGKSRAGSKAFAYKGPHGLRGVKSKKVQGINLVTMSTPVGKMKVSMKAYKTYFKKAWTAEDEAALQLAK
jgi:ribosomal protein L28